MTLKEGGLRGSLRNVGVGVPDIPDSVVQQHFATTWSQGDATWVDDIANADMSISGDPQDASLSDGIDALSFDGTDDYGQSSPFASIEGGSLQSFAVEFAFELSSTDTETILRREDSTNQTIEITLNVNESFNADAGNAFIRLTDQNDTGLRCGFDTNPGLNDGSRKDLSVIFDDASANSVTLIVNDTEYTPTFSVADGPNDFTSWGGDLSWFADVQKSRRYFSGSVGAVRWHDSAISSQTIGDYS